MFSFRQVNFPIKFKHLLIASLLLAIVVTLNAYFLFGKIYWQRNFLQLLVILVTWSLLAPFIYARIKQSSLENKITVRIIAGLFAIGIVFVSLVYLIHLISNLLLGYFLGPIYEIGKIFENQITKVGQVYASLYVDYLILTVFLSMVHLYRDAKHQKEQKLDLQARLKESQLYALRMQLNPHFLFNALNSVSSLIGKNDQGQKIISNLSQLLRVTLKEQSATVELETEIKNLKLYLNIEGVRFQDRLRISYAIDNSALSIQVPSMILQPLVENSIQHGLGETIEDMNLDILCEVASKELLIVIEDNGPGLKKKPLEEGIGIENLRKRLKIQYEKDNCYRIEFPPNGGCKNIIRIPV